MGVPAPTDPVLYKEHVIYFFDKEVPANIRNMNKYDQDRVYEMIDRYAPQLEKLFYSIQGLDVLEYAQDKRFAAANANPHEGIDYNYDCPIIKGLAAWRRTRI